MKRFIMNHEAGIYRFVVLYLLGGISFCFWLGGLLAYVLFILSGIAIMLYLDHCFPSHDPMLDILREYHIINIAQSAVPMKCGTCRMFLANKCHRVAPFADVVETDFCMKYDINPRCDEYISAKKAAEKAFNG